MMRAAALEKRELVEFASSDLVDLSWTPWRRIMLSPRDNVWTLVDACDHAWLSEHVWNEWHAGAGDWMRYAKRNVGPDRATVRMHREILIVADPRSERFLRTHVGDHVNGQTLDNRRANLRWSTKLANARNRRPQGSAPSLDAIVLELLATLGPRPEIQEVPF
ncbi:MAG: HNH endonuclease [Rhizobiales bacterium]|nr:HNH endonuclease [Hyphomicrobiales bacterium]